MADELSPLLHGHQSISFDSQFDGSAQPVHYINGCHSCHPHPPFAHPRSWIPKAEDTKHHPNRTLIVCFDGTGDSFDEDNTNVVRFVSALSKHEPSKQVVYYQAGIGTNVNPVLKTPLVSDLTRTLDQMVAWNLATHIINGYKFLMQHYHDGDRICIFGFSRGAFQARALAGMLQKVGLLPPSNHDQLSFAWMMYKRSDERGLTLSQMFKQTFSSDVRVYFLGCWDTVQSVGLIPRYLPFSGKNHSVLFFRHAIALDERRVRFIPSFSTSGLSRFIKHQTPDPESVPESVPKQPEYHAVHAPNHAHREDSYKEYEHAVNLSTGIKTDVKEVLFAGAHCDVGGGSVLNETRHTLARIPLRWMIRECFRTKTGIIFDEHMLENDIGLDLENILDLHCPAPSRTKPDGVPLESFGDRDRDTFVYKLWLLFALPFTLLWNRLKRLRIDPNLYKLKAEGERWFSEGESVEEMKDALSPIYDQMYQSLFWQIMEYIPFLLRKPSAEVYGNQSTWAYRWVWNRGAGRKIYRPIILRGMMVHRSVRTRLEAVGKNDERYVPKVELWIEEERRTRPLTAEEWLDDNNKLFKWVE